jgi:hypothetical protein
MGNKRLSVAWLCPLAGGAATAAFLTLRVLPYDESALFFAVAFLRDSLANYLVALPALFVACRLGLKSLLGYALVSVASAFPVGWVLAHPIPFAWQWTEEEFASGPYWSVMCGYMFFSSATGLLFGVNAKQA